MNPFKEFSHFIALFVPGMLLFIVLLAAGSLLAQKDLLQGIPASGAAGLLITAVMGTALGIILDEARHSSIEDWLTDFWTKRAGYDPSKLKQDFVGYIPPMTPDLYVLIRDEGYYFYEFDVNIGLVLVIAACTLPFYLRHFHHELGPLSLHPIIAFVVLFLSGLCVGMWFGSSAYKYSVRSFVAAMENLNPGFQDQVSFTREAARNSREPA